MKDKKYPLDRDEKYLDSLDMTKEYTDEEIRDIYDIINHRNDPKQIEVIGNNTENFMFGNIFVPKRFMSDEKAKKETSNLREDKENSFLCFTGRISQEEFNKRIFVDVFRKELKKNKNV